MLGSARGWGREYRRKYKTGEEYEAEGWREYRRCGRSNGYPDKANDEQTDRDRPSDRKKDTTTTTDRSNCKGQTE